MKTRSKQEKKDEKKERLEKIVNTEDDETLGFEQFITQNMGRGVKATRDFWPGDYLLEYSGEKIDKKTALDREKMYSENEGIGCYMMYSQNYCIDATEESTRLGRIINHSRKKANCKPKIVNTCDYSKIIFQAIKAITVDEELFYNYQDTRKEIISAFPWLGH